ncbi:phage tail assembly chaperone [Intestinimonas sp.]
MFSTHDDSTQYKAMLLPGEIEDLSRAVEKLCGYRANTIEEIKNA